MKSKIAGASLIAGAIWVAYNRLREPASLDSTYADAPTQILIVGGGFGGLAAAKELARTLSGSQDEPPPLVDSLDVQKDDRGRLLVDRYLRVKSRPGVYAAGDCASID